jgi:SPP1 family predicted phage head-tail adaptor
MSAPILASKIRHRLVLQKPVYSRDELGSTMVSWQNVVSLWASIDPIRGGERFENQKVETRQNFKISTRYRADIVPNMRLRKASRLFLIRNIANIDEENHTLEMVCEEIINN